MTWIPDDTYLGLQPIANTSSTQQHPLGTRVTAYDSTYGNGEFIYLKGVVDTVLGSWVLYDQDGFTTTLLAADDVGNVAVAMAANVANQYGWYQIRGVAVGKAAAGFIDDAAVYITATAGTVDDAVVAGDLVYRAKGASAVAAGVAEFTLDLPYVQNADILDPTAVTASSAEVNYNDITTLGTLAASKTWTSDSNLDTIMPTGGLLTVQSGGAITMNAGSTLTNNATVVSTAVAAEHGAGAIGTAATPATYRRTEHGVIITQIKIDLTGLASVATANDVIGLAAGGAAYIGRNVVATNGIIFKTEFSCIETPAGGDNDVNVVTSNSATLAYNDAGGTTYISNSGDLLAGQTIENLVPALTANDYFYLTAGTGDTAATYTAGMYLLTLYGHALLA